MDPITVQILRNKIASLVDEMHYHFYRSGYYMLSLEPLVIGQGLPTAERRWVNSTAHLCEVLDGYRADGIG